MHIKTGTGASCCARQYIQDNIGRFRQVKRKLTEHSRPEERHEGEHPEISLYFSYPRLVPESLEMHIHQWEQIRDPKMFFDPNQNNGE